MLEFDGEDLRHLPLERRKPELKILVERTPFVLAINDVLPPTAARSFHEA